MQTEGMKHDPANGSILKALRKRRKKTQRDLSVNLGKSRSYISRIENNQKLVNKEELETILNALEVGKEEYESMLRTSYFFEEISHYSQVSEPSVSYESPSELRSLLTIPNQQTLISLLKAYFKDKPVEEVFLFGSVARNEHHEGSDIDLLIRFKGDYKASLFDLVDMKIEIESLTGLPADIVEKGTEYHHPEVEWRKIEALRHFLVHEYYRINPEILWNTKDLYLEDLMEKINSFIESVGDN